MRKILFVFIAIFLLFLTSCSSSPHVESFQFPPTGQAIKSYPINTLKKKPVVLVNKILDLRTEKQRIDFLRYMATYYGQSATVIDYPYYLTRWTKICFEKSRLFSKVDFVNTIDVPALNGKKISENYDFILEGELSRLTYEGSLATWDYDIDLVLRLKDFQGRERWSRTINISKAVSDSTHFSVLRNIASLYCDEMNVVLLNLYREMEEHPENFLNE